MPVQSLHLENQPRNRQLGLQESFSRILELGSSTCKAPRDWQVKETVGKAGALARPPNPEKLPRGQIGCRELELGEAARGRLV